MQKPKRKDFPNTQYGTNLYISSLLRYIKYLESKTTLS